MDQKYVTSLELVTLRSVGKSVLVISEKGPSKVRRGILRFFGTVEFASGQFCGIELETPQGKHNGSFKGIRYFQCTPDHGIFVPAEKVYNDPKSRIKTIAAPSTTILNKGILKKSHSDVHINIGTASSRVNKEVSTQDNQSFTNSNLFDILSTISNDIPQSNVDKKRYTSSPKISSKIVNSSKYVPPSRPCTSVPEKKSQVCIISECGPMAKISFTNRPNSVTNESKRNCLAKMSSSSHDNVNFERHCSLTETGHNEFSKSQTECFHDSAQIHSNCLCTDKDFSNLPEKGNSFHLSNVVNSIGSINLREQLIGQSSSLHLQQNVLAKSMIPEIPRQSDTSLKINSFIKSNRTFFEEINNGGEIIQIIDRDNCNWSKSMQVLQQCLNKLKDDIDVLCYRHLEVISHVPSIEIAPTFGEFPKLESL